MPTSLRELIDRLERKYLCDEPTAALRGRIVNLLAAKLRRAAPITRSVLAQHWHPGESVDAFLDRADTTQFRVLLGREVDIRFLLAQQLGQTTDKILFAEPRESGVESVRFDGAILFRRPAERVISWRGPVSISKPDGYSKHMFQPRYRGAASLYAEGLSPRTLELAVFRCGRGYFHSNHRLFLFGSFTSPIGTVKVGGRREDSTVLKVQLDRVPRNTRTITAGFAHSAARRQGFWTKMHGYPISHDELRADFPAGAAAVLASAAAIPFE